MTAQDHNDAFLDWILAYDPILWRIARTYAPHGESKDLHQDLLIAVWHAAPTYRDQAKPSTFIYRVALNCALNWNRGRARYLRRHVELDEDAPRLSVPPHTSSPVAGEREARVERLYAALATLPDGDRSLALLHLDGLSYREIGEVLGITESNTGVKLNRIKKRLAAQLRQMEGQDKGALG